MPSINLFRNSIGVFQGFSNSGLEFHADLMLPYRPEFQITPMHGSFLLIELENENEAVLGRISSVESTGRLAGNAGTEYAIRAAQRDKMIPEDIMVDHLRYKVDIRVLGVLRNNGSKIVFAPSHRRLPHVGSRVAFPDSDVLKSIVGDIGDYGIPIGHLALGEFVYAKGDEGRAEIEDWHQLIEPVITPHFDIRSLVSRKTFIFARAGYGKSNLNKQLFARLYSETYPPAIKIGDKEIPVGTLIFDPEGEYFWPDVNNRPGLADVPELRDRLVVFTDRKHKSKYYDAFKVGGARFDLSRMTPSQVFGLLYQNKDDPEKWVQRVKGLNLYRWSQTIHLINEKGFGTDLEELASTMGVQSRKDLTEAQLNAARRELTILVRSYHQSGLATFEIIEAALQQGKIVVFDISQLPPQVGENISRLIMNKIFKKNQQAFTDPSVIPMPVITVIEEAQTIVGKKDLDDTDPIVAWVKEGRKYNLGAVLVTQQPGSISEQILSQGDNWFAFHLISGGDLSNLHKANGHFSDDILQSLLNEPIKGQGMMWSSESPRPYPISVRVFAFEKTYSLADPDNSRTDHPTEQKDLAEALTKSIYGDHPEDNVALLMVEKAMESVSKDKAFMTSLKKGQVHTAWFAMALRNKLNPQFFSDDFDEMYAVACDLIPIFLNKYIGEKDEIWKEEEGTHRGKKTTYYKIL